MRLVDALQDEGQQVLGLADELRGTTDVVGGDAADVGDVRRRIGLDSQLECVETDRVAGR